MAKNNHHKIHNVVVGTVVEFQRQEFKFMLPNSLVDILVPELLSFMRYDNFSQEGPYGIHSIYFDTYDWQAFYAKMDGDLHRQKFRIRSYVAHPGEEENVFLEIKEKYNSTVYKRRYPVLLKDARRVADGESLGIKSRVLDQWRYSIIRDRIKPKLLNSYSRRAFMSDQYPGLRITIDQNLEYSLVNDIDFTQAEHKAYWSQGKSVIEVKFDKHVPRFVIDILRRHNLAQGPVSKYCDSVISHYLLS